MCGFFGILGDSIKDNSTRIRIKNSLVHRGPDGCGEYIGTNLSFIHTRLSINDLSNFSKQPFVRDKNILLFNGEIYNFKSLSSKVGSIENPNSDTEVLFKLFLKYGVKCLPWINGMFSFAFWKNDEKKLYLVRDRFGEKPLYYCNDQKKNLIFASEIKALKASQLIDFKINKLYLNNVLINNYQDPDKSIYHNIYNLKPGNYVVYSDDKAIQIVEYFSKKELYKIDNSIKYIDAKNKIKDILVANLKEQLSASVDVSILLSGGLDSSLLTAIASKLKNKVKTFTFAFNNQDEEVFSKKISDFYNTEHFFTRESEFSLVDEILRMQSIFDEPFSDSSCIPSYLTYKHVSKYSKAVITGDGADEIFFGYANWYKRVFQFKNFSNNNNVSNFLFNFFKNIKFNRIGFINNAKKNFFLKSNFNNYRDLFRKLRSNLNYESLLYLSKDQKSSVKCTNFNYEEFLIESLNDILEHYLPGNILLKSDRCSMANSVESRSPFLSNDLVSFVSTLPLNFKLTNIDTKIILRDICKDFKVPEIIIKRPKKGFGSPVSTWLKRKDIKNLKYDLFLNKNSKIYNYYDYDFISSIIDSYNQTEWSILNMSLWLEINN